MLSKKNIVADTLLREITQQEWMPGEFIPSRNQLMRRFHCSRTVIERAVAELTAAGILAGKQGKGTYVCSPPILRQKTEIRKLNVVSPYDAKSFRSPFTCLLLNSGDLDMPLEIIPSDHADSEAALLCQPESAAVFINPGFEQLPLMNHLKQHNVPLLVINREFDDFNRIYTDTFTGLSAGMAAVKRQSHAPWALISRNPQLKYPYQAPRLLDFYRACAARSVIISPEKTLLAPFDDPEKEIAEAAKLFHTIPLNICVLNSDLLLPLLSLADALRLIPGKDLFILAFEYIHAAANTPGVTMIRQRYDLFYQELRRFIDSASDLFSGKFISPIPPEIICGSNSEKT